MNASWSLVAVVCGLIGAAPCASACDGVRSPGGADAANADCPPTPAPTAERANPALCARQAELVGPESCAWTTTMMAQRVLEQGVPWTYVGRLTAAEGTLPSKVAAPYTVGPDATIHVIANEVLDALVRDGAAPARVGPSHDNDRVELSGKVLEVEGITYFVATELVRSRS